jgi:large subunit ribosomal protein L15
MADGKDSIDLTAMGIGKLLGSGRINTALTIKVEEWSAKAAEKIEAAGGSIEDDDDDDENNEE